MFSFSSAEGPTRRGHTQFPTGPARPYSRPSDRTRQRGPARWLPCPLPSGSLIGSALVTPIDIPVLQRHAPRAPTLGGQAQGRAGQDGQQHLGRVYGSVIDEALYENLEDAP